MLKWLRGIDWPPLVSAALFYVLAVELLSSFGFPQHTQHNQHANDAAPSNAFEYIRHILPETPEGWTALFTCTLTISTIGLWLVTASIARDARNAAAKTRSIVRGGGLEVHSGLFQIEASNAGDGAALIQTIRWGFGDLGKLPTIPVYTEEAPGDALFARTPYRPIRHTKSSGGLNAVIFFRLEYFDVHQKRKAVIGHVLQIRSPAFPMVPIQLREGIPDEYLIDTFPVDIES
jgi:hypothetical protein